VTIKSISVIGNVNADIIARPVETLPPPGAEAFVDELSFRPDGGAGVTSMALAALGADVHLHGSIGDDAIGKTVAPILAAAGVHLSGLVLAVGSKTAISLAFESPARDRCPLSARAI
jgi:ribokinase